MSASIFWRTVISGFIATFIMAMISFLQGGLGLPTIDIAYLIHQTLNYVHSQEFYTIFWANTAYIIGGILLALFWVAFLHQIMPGNWLVKGILYGIFLSVFSGLIIAPLVALAGGDSFGVFYHDTWIPGKMLLAGLTMHLGYGLSLMLCLNVAGIDAHDYEQ